MPIGGQISAGSGIRLQPTTPGVSDVGNENINGKIIAGNTMEPLTSASPWRPIPLPGTSCMVIGTNPTFIGGGSTNQPQDGTMCWGRGQTIQMNPNGNSDGTRLMIGDQIITYGGLGITIGYQATNGSSVGWPSAYAASVVIGWAAKAKIQESSGNDSAVVIGRSAGEVIDTAGGSILIGHQATSTNATGNNIVIGKKYGTGGTNNVVIAQGGAGLNVPGSNTILIGDASHTKITLGPWDFSNGSASAATNVADANSAVTPQIGTVNYTSITAPRVCTLPAANTVPNGFRILVYDSSGSVTGVNTVSLTRAGADTINGGAGPSLVNVAFGLKELICDGVSKWTIIRSI